jgi:hypothetical protein
MSVTGRSRGAELLVYRAESQDPAPVQTITQALVDAAGVAVDSSGNGYYWTFATNAAGTFHLPLFLTIDNGILTIPSYVGKAAAMPATPMSSISAARHPA